MKLFAMMDALLRDRFTLYKRLIDGEDLGKLTVQMLLIFVLTAGLYGAAMGAFRWIHPEYVFSDFEISVPGQAPIRGKVSGMTQSPNAIYTEQTGLPMRSEAEIRFNLSQPTEPYRIDSISREKGYGKIVLAPEAELAEPNSWRMPLLVAVKTPLLFLLTLIICVPALYVINLALGMGLRFMPAVTLMAFALAATGIMLGVFIPIVAMFSVVTQSYHFMQMLHLGVFTLAGLFGVRILGEGLLRLAPEGSKRIKTLPIAGLLLISWLMLYALVGGQLAWTLKPFLGTPYLPETPPFRIESGNIYVSAFETVGKLFD